MERYLLESPSACTVEVGDEVWGMPHLCSCCLILVRTKHVIMAQHWPGTDPAMLDDDLFPADPIEMLMVTGLESVHQIQQARTLHARYPEASLAYYAYNTNDYPMPVVRVAEEAFVLLNSENYHPVSIDETQGTTELTHDR